MLRGRQAEQAAIDDLLARMGGAIVVRGEPGIGKSALLAHAAERAQGVRVLRAVGAEGETELAFATLHQLLQPVLDGVDALPAPQAGALRAAFGLQEHGSPDRFLVAMAALTLLSEVGPVLCLVDDAHWLDAPTLEALAFVARRIEAEPIALIMASREAVQGFRELRLEGLDPDAAAELLDERSGGALVAPVRERILAASEGNPLALLELPAGAGAPGEPVPLAGELERAFLARVRRHPPAVQSVVLLAAAEGSGRLATVRAAAGRLGLDPAPLESRDLADVLRIEGAKIGFRHPLVRSAVYHHASPGERRAAHGALAAEEPEADRRAWHGALAADGPDEDVAAELQAAAERALSRSGPAAAAAAFERAAELSGEGETRAGRLAAAAEARWSAGDAERALALIDRTEGAVRAPLAPARLRVQYLRGFIELRAGVPADALATLLPVIREAAEADPDRAVRALLAAREAAFLAVDPAALAEIAETIPRLRPPDPEHALIVHVLQSYASAAPGPSAAAPPDLDRLEEIEDLTLLLAAGGMAWGLGAHRLSRRLRNRAVTRARGRGAAAIVAWALEPLVAEEVFGGRYAEAEAYASEGRDLARETAQPNVACLHVAHLAVVAGLRGREDEARRLAAEALAEATTRGLGRAAATAHHALGTLALAAGDAEEALGSFEAIWGSGPSPGSRWLAVPYLPDQLEAAVRTGRGEEAWVTEFGRWADSIGSPEMRALAARCRALVADGDAAVHEYEAALRLHAEAERPLDHARTELLLGELLRRERRRVDARAHLRTALDAFEQLGTPVWAQRARQELRATGETARKRDPSTLDQLTPQEVQVVRAVSTGATNRDVAAQLFISPRTVDHHLRKVFRKLQISSRKQLIAMALSGDEAF